MTTTKRKQPTESELRDLLFDSYLLGHMCGSQPLPFSVAAYEPTASQLLALRAAMAKGVHAHRHMLSPSCSAPPVDLTRLLTKDEVAKEVERLLGQKLVELVVAVEPEQPELAAMTSQIPLVVHQLLNRWNEVESGQSPRRSAPIGWRRSRLPSFSRC